MAGNSADAASQNLGAYKDYKWYNSLNLPIEVQCGICRLELPVDIKANSPEVPQDVYFTAHIVCNQMSMHESPVSTAFSQRDDVRNSLSWEYVLTFPLRVRDLSLDSIIVLTAWTPEGNVYGGTTMKFFDEFGALKRGKQKLMFYFETKGDANVLMSHNTTPGETYKYYEAWDYRFKMEKDLELYGSQQAAAGRVRGGGESKHEWLDRLALAHIQDALDSQIPRTGADVYDSIGAGRGRGEDSLQARVRRLSATSGGNAGSTGNHTAGVDASASSGDGDVVSSPTSADDMLPDAWARAPEEYDLETFCFLIVEMPLFQYPVLYEEKHYPSVAPHVPPNSQMEMLSSLIVEENDAFFEFSLAGRPFNASFLTIVADWDMDQENLAEDQNRKLSQHSRRGAVDSSAKPNKTERERINNIVTAVGSHMTNEELDLLYKFRYSLTDNKRALVKFLYCVNWGEEAEVAEVPTLLDLWSKKAPIDVEDALKLLSREKCFEHPIVREYAVSILRGASDEELMSFLLQLVQALRYEPSPVVSSSTSVVDRRDNDGSASSASSGVLPPPPPPTVEFNLEQSIVGVKVMSVHDAPPPPPPVADGTSTTTAAAVSTGAGVDGGDGDGSSGAKRPSSVLLPATVTRTAGSLSPLAKFLIDRACSSAYVANFLYWYLKVETEDEASGMLFQTVFDNFIVQLSTSGHEGKMLFRRLCALDDYVDKIAACQRDARDQGRRKEGKEQMLQKLLEERELQNIPRGVDWVPQPLYPSIQLQGLVPQSASMFASAVYPCVIEFVEYQDPSKHENHDSSSSSSSNAQSSQETSQLPPSPPAAATGHDTSIKRSSKKPQTHKVMFKSGDDLRQDQLIMQMISLMDRLLKKVNLDLKLLTYGILAVGQNDGLMEFVRNSMPISAVLKNFNNSIADYLRHHNPDRNGPYEIAPIALDTFIKSCAGCCVITYILGIGDRHLDNIMINTSGQMFHIDFGFIFGQDPKPMPPPFRFIRAMADCMGGEDSEHYARFKTFCCQSYNWLRKSANLILNLLSLMGDAGIQDISKRSDLPKVLVKVQEKFRLDLTDEQAEQFFLGLINESLHSLAPRIMELAHKVAVSMR